MESFDMFGEPIGVNYRGQSTYTTKIGGFCSILAYGLVLAYTAAQFFGMIHYDNNTIVAFDYNLNSEDHPDLAFPLDYFDIEIIFSGSGPRDKPIEKKYG